MAELGIFEFLFHLRCHQTWFLLENPPVISFPWSHSLNSIENGISCFYLRGFLRYSPNILKQQNKSSHIHVVVPRSSSMWSGVVAELSFPTVEQSNPFEIVKIPYLFRGCYRILKEIGSSPACTNTNPILVSFTQGFPSIAVFPQNPGLDRWSVRNSEGFVMPQFQTLHLSNPCMEYLPTFIP